MLAPICPNILFTPMIESLSFCCSFDNDEGVGCEIRSLFSWEIEQSEINVFKKKEALSNLIGRDTRCLRVQRHLDYCIEKKQQSFIDSFDIVHTKPSHFKVTRALGSFFLSSFFSLISTLLFNKSLHHLLLLVMEHLLLLLTPAPTLLLTRSRSMCI